MKYLLKAHRKIGEVAIDMAILNAIRRLDPDCRIEVLIDTSCSELLSETPFIERLHVLRGGSSSLGLQARLLRQRWDVVLTTRRASRLQLFHRLARATHKKCRRFMDTPKGKSEMEIRLSMLDGILDGWESPVDPTVHFDQERVVRVSDRFGLDGGGRFLSIAPGASTLSKAWGQGNFMDLAGKLSGSFDKVLVLGSEPETDLCQAVSGRVGGLNLAGRTSLLDTCALLSLVSLHVGNDSGLGHLAAAAGTPCLAIGSEYGPRYKPWKQHMIAGDPKGITVSAVAECLSEQGLA